MDAVDILKVCLRRWYVMLPILLGAAGVSFQLVEAEEPTYTASTSYGLVQPALAPGSEDEAEANPLGSGGNALVGEAIEAQLNSRETQARLGSDQTRGWGPGEAVNYRSYTVRIPPFETTYEVRAWGEDEDAVRAVVDGVIEAAPDIADELQVRAGVPPPQRFQPFVLAPTQVEQLPSTSGLKLVIAVMGVGLLMGAAWSVVADRVLGARRARRPAGGPTAGPDGTPDGTAAEEPVDAPAEAPVEAPAPPPQAANGTTKAGANPSSRQAAGRTNGHARGRSPGKAGSASGRR